MKGSVDAWLPRTDGVEGQSAGVGGPVGVPHLGGLCQLSAGGRGPVQQLIVARVGPQETRVGRPVQVGHETRVALGGRRDIQSAVGRGARLHTFRSMHRQEVRKWLKSAEVGIATPRLTVHLATRENPPSAAW